MEENKEAKTLEVSDGSYINFYKNGVLQEHNFFDIYEGTYHAAVSLYMHGRCRVNFGKNPFVYSPFSSKVVSDHAVRGRQWLPYSMLSEAHLSQSTHSANLSSQFDLQETSQFSEASEYQEKRGCKSKAK